MTDKIDWSKVEAEFEALPELTEQQIAALPPDELARQATIEARYMTLTMVRVGQPQHTMEQAVIDHAETFTPEQVQIARDRLRGARIFCSPSSVVLLANSDEDITLCNKQIADAVAQQTANEDKRTVTMRDPTSDELLATYEPQ